MIDADLPRGWLDVAGFLEGTLKSSLWVDILRHYERHFAEFKYSDIEILEIGVNTGSSLAIWKQYFTKAKLIGVDINPACRRFEDDRVKIEIGSQDDPAFLSRIVSECKPTIIIDDGSHLAHHIPFTFEFLFPFLASGGIYVIEDMFFHFQQPPNRLMGFTEIRPTDYLFDIVRQLFTEKPDPAVNYGMRAFLRSHIEEIAFAPLGVAFIRKKPHPLPMQDRITVGEKFAEHGNSAILWARLAEYILRNGGPADRAERAAKKAIDLTPALAQAHRTLATALMRRNMLDHAIAAADKAVGLEPNNAEYHDFLGQLYVKAGDLPKAEAHFSKAVARRDHPATRRRLEELLRAQDKPVLLPKQ
jgi:tetratricopeptide (TPR) repeat protein